MDEAWCGSVEELLFLSGHGIFRSERWKTIVKGRHRCFDGLGDLVIGYRRNDNLGEFRGSFWSYWVCGILLQ
jgi:hypothetical protein